MKKFKLLINDYVKNISEKYDLDMNMIEGVHHNEFILNSKHHRASLKEIHLYHIVPRNKMR